MMTKLNGLFLQYRFVQMTYGIDRLQIFRALVGHVPPRPLWAELIWEREEDLRRQAESTTSPGAASGARLKPNSQMQKQ